MQGDAYLKTEKARLEKVLSGKVAAAKADEMARKVSIMGALLNVSARGTGPGARGLGVSSAYLTAGGIGLQGVHHGRPPQRECKRHSCMQGLHAGM